MAVHRIAWLKYTRAGSLLLVAILFIPVLVIFLVQTLALLPKNTDRMISVVSQSMPMMEAPGGMMGRMGEGKMGRVESGMMPMAVDTAAMMPMWGSLNMVSLSGRKVVQSASLDLRVQSLEWTNNQIQQIVKNVGGYVESANVSQPRNGVKTAWLSVRVPADRLDVTLDEAKKTASSVAGEHLSAGDVTDQNIDLDARLNAKRAEETALVSVFEQATKVSDVIEVTSRLSMVRSEIERMEAEQRSLASQVAMSSISLTITEDPQIVVNTDPLRNGNAVKQSVTDISRWGIALGSALVALMISGLPVIIIYGFIIWVAYRFGRFVANKIVPRRK